MNRLPRKITGHRLLLAACFLLVASVFVQNSHASSAAQAPASATASAEDSKSAGEAGEDVTTQFRQSASVKLLARITGLSLGGAYWLAVVLNFAIVAGVIAWFSRKNLPGAFRRRSAEIQKSLEEARHASEDASRRLAAIEDRLRHLDKEIADMRAVSEREAAAEEERIRAATAEEAQRILEAAEQEIAAAGKAARRELTEYAADLAVSLASKQIHVPPRNDDMLVRRFVQQLSSAGSPPRKT